MNLSKMIEVKNIYKKYKKYTNPKERFLDVFFPNKYVEEFYALHDVNFTANEGEVIGFIGINGSGKSTLSNIIAGIVPESSGTVKVNGEVAIIAVAAGLNNELTGRDNIELKLLMLGFSKKEIKDLEPEIIEFAELEDFIDQPVKSYSSGMKSRLGFSISVSVNPDILIIDEALSVGDRAFAEKSLAKMKEFKNDGKTMIFVSHSLNQMQRFCDKILWLEYGRVKEFGPTKQVIDNYKSFLEIWKRMTNNERRKYRQNIILNQEEKNREYLNSVEKEISNKIHLRSISRVGKLKEQPNIYVYEYPTEDKKRKLKEDEKNKTLYIKQRIIYREKRYFLISQLASGKDGVIGWVKGEDIKTQTQNLIDEDQKLFEVIGDKSAYSRPWGSTGDIVIENLSSFRGKHFKVVRTERIGRHLWYYGDLEGKNLWIRWNQLERIN